MSAIATVERLRTEVQECLCPGQVMKPLSAQSSQPDLRILRRLDAVQTVCFFVVALIAGSVLCGWLVPAIGTHLPGGWSLMKANTALAFLLATAAAILTQTKQSGRRIIEGRACAVVVMVIAGAALFAYSTGHPIGIETILVADSGAKMPGRMAVQTGVYLEFIGLILIFENASRKPWIHLVDALTMTFVLLILSIFAGYMFDTGNLFGETTYTRVAPQILACMLSLAIAVIGRRARNGFFSVLVGEAIGSQTARITLPFAVMLPFFVVTGSAYSTHAKWLSAPYAAALAASVCSVVIFGFVVLMARRINALERELRDTSLTDELTHIHNRRAFYLLGEHALLEARRNGLSLTVLFFDLNGLKQVNDTLGHEIGSRLLVRAADLLRSNFRSNDVVARVGGDEFAVVTHSTKDELISALNRLDKATAAVNNSGNSYHISFSMGEAAIDLEAKESFAGLVQRADAVMYARKRTKKAQRKVAGTAGTDGTEAYQPMATGVLAAYVAQKDRR
jgi:diguanylate cyclase (GGDEF)-like protein